MSKMFVVAIDDNAKADAFLAALQSDKVVAYPDKQGVFHKAKVTFIYLTDRNGSCPNHKE